MYTNPYHRRLAHRLAKAREKKGEHAARLYLEIDRFMLQFEQAYATYYNVHLTVQHKRGWYYINNHPYRRCAVEEWTNNLLAKIQELDSPTPTEEG